MNKVQVVLLSILTFSLLAYKLNKPFWGHHEFNGVYYGMIAKNYLRYGLIETRGGQVNNLWPTEKENWSYHANHPATYPFTLAILFKIFGTSETTARIFSIICSIAGIILLGKLLNEVFKNQYSWLAIIPILFTPIFRYYGSLPVFEPILFPLIVLGLHLYWKSTKSAQYNKALIVVCFLAMIIDWPGFWLPVWLIIAELLTTKRKRLVFYLLLSIIATFLIILLLQQIGSGSIKEIFGVGKYRLQAAPYTSLAWIRLLIARSRAFFGDFVLISSFTGFLSLLKRRKSKDFSICLASLGLGLSHIFVFRNITWYHDYMLYHLLPFVGISLATFFFRTLKSRKSLLGILISVLTLATFLETKLFFTDLTKMQGHKDCIEMGSQVKNSEEKLTFKLNAEKAKECPPFIGFYGDKPFAIEVVKD